MQEQGQNLKCTKNLQSPLCACRYCTFTSWLLSHLIDLNKIYTNLLEFEIIKSDLHQQISTFIYCLV